MLIQNIEKAVTIAKETMLREVHVVEFWMPQLHNKRNCNLECGHCYVPPGGISLHSTMSAQEYMDVLEKILDTSAHGGKWDVVFPGMEPMMSQNRDLVFALAGRAQEQARSIGMTTNGTYFGNGEVVKRVMASPVSTINVSIDGGREAHDFQRGREGLFDLTMEGLRNICADSSLRRRKKVITNTTITKTNSSCLTNIAAIAHDAGCDYAAFHPFESAENADNSLRITQENVAQAIVDLIRGFDEGRTGSAVIEFEPSTAGVFFSLFERDVFEDFELLEDVTGFRYMRKQRGDKELLVNLIFYPHHWIRTIRVLPNGSLSSCRQMALSGWKGIGNLREQSLRDVSMMPEAVDALAELWQEYFKSTKLVKVDVLNRFLSLNNGG